MIKKALVTIGILSTLFMVGCATSQDTISAKYSDNRFYSLRDSYVIAEREYFVYVDKLTNIVYLTNPGGYGNGSISPIIGKDKLPITLDEYKEMIK